MSSQRQYKLPINPTGNKGNGTNNYQSCKRGQPVLIENKTGIPGSPG